MPHERKPGAPHASAAPLGRPKSSGSRQQVTADQTTHTGSPELDKAHAAASTPPKRTRKR